LIALAIGVTVLAVGGWFALHAGVALLQSQVAAALGPGASVGAIRADWNDVEVTDLRIAGSKGWPADDSLRAERVRIAPSWRSLLSDRIEVARIEATGAYLSGLRSSDGHLRVLPTLVPGAASGETAAPPVATATPPTPASAARAVAIRELRVANGTLELFDATVATPPWKIRLQEIDASLRDVVAPLLAGRMPFEVSAVLAGPGRNGRVEFSGWLDANTRDLELEGKLRGVDLLALQPYFVEKTKGRLTAGALDLDVHAVVKNRRLHAPGRLTLSQIAFDSTGNATTRIFGVPRDLLLAGLEAKGGKIELDFSLDGDIDDPHFKLNEMLSTRIAVEMAKALGFSVGGLVEGAGGLGFDALEGSGKAAGGLGSALKKLFPKRN
jgi:hypothetical protein